MLPLLRISFSLIHIDAKPDHLNSGAEIRQQGLWVGSPGYTHLNSSKTSAYTLSIEPGSARGASASRGKVSLRHWQTRSFDSSPGHTLCGRLFFFSEFSQTGRLRSFDSSPAIKGDDTLFVLNSRKLTSFYVVQIFTRKD